MSLYKELQEQDKTRTNAKGKKQHEMDVWVCGIFEIVTYYLI